ncbi:MAG: ComF family protein [Pirellulales bacterium]
MQAARGRFLRLLAGTASLAGGLCDLVFSPRCAACDAELVDPAAGPFCAECNKEALAGAGERCPRCGAELPPDHADTGCPACGSTELATRLSSPNSEVRGRRGAVQRVWCLGAYDGSLRALVLRMKHVEEEPLSAAMAELLWRRVGAELAGWRPDVVLPVPMHWTRRLARGTNSPQVVSGVLARRLEVPHAPKALVRRRKTRQQGPLTRTARRINLRRAFAVPAGVRFEQARVLLVDDILTSGATSSEAARELRRAGASATALVVVAQTGLPDAVPR